MTETKFSTMARPNTIWAISAVHGEHKRLEKLHDNLIDHIQPGDRVIYTGNIIGYGRHARQTIDEVLTFRRNVMAIDGVKPSDIIFIRGVQEDMWLRLLQLHYCPNPIETLVWMLGNGLAATLNDYGFSAHDGIHAARQGSVELAKWTSCIADRIRKTPGHEQFNMHLKRAAHTGYNDDSPLLFVHAGIDETKSLDAQGEQMLWPSKDFNSISNAYNPFARVIRGYDPKHKGLHINCVTATIDGGCGFGGTLVAAGFAPDGNVEDVFEI